MATNGGRRWTMDDAWWMDLDPPTINEPNPPRFDDGEAAAAVEGETLWADDASAWSDEPLTSPDIGGDGGDDAPSGGPPAAAAAATRPEEEVDPLWAYS
jgi:hypothetical protein